MNQMLLKIRPATATDAATILRFIRELAAYEREPDAVLATEADLIRDGWSNPPRFNAIIADCNGDPAGFALCFTTYSTWRGHHGIRLEDIYVTPSLRGHGIGKALLATVARIAVEQGCPRLEWDVLDWNEPAIAFYRSIGAEKLSQWSIMRLSDAALQSLSSHAPAVS